MSNKLTFTKASIFDLKGPTKGFKTYYDAKLPGLCLLVTAKGVKTFYVYRKIQGRPERIKIARFPELSIELARKRASELIGEIASGKNPQKEKRALRAEMTFKNLADQFIQRHSKPHNKSWKEDERRINTHLSSLHSYQLSQITKEVVVRRHQKIGENSGYIEANRCLALISSIFGKARDWGYKGENPTEGIQRYKETSRDRFLRPDELSY